MQKVKLILEQSSEWVHIINKRKSEVVDTFLDGINKAKTTLKKGHDVYVMPKSLITRDDMTHLKDEMNISQKRKSSTYDRTILSKKYIDNLVTDDWNTSIHVVNRAALISALEYIIDNHESIQIDLKTKSTWWGNSIEDLDTFKRFFNNVKANSTVSDAKIGFYKSTLAVLRINSIDLSKHTVVSDYNSTIDYVMSYMLDEDYKEFQSIWKQRNKVVTEDYVKKLVTNSNPMTLDTVKSLDKIFKGTNDDAELAVVTLSKMDYKDNLDLLYYLVTKHEKKIMWTKAISTAGCRDLKVTIKNMPWSRTDNLLENLRQHGNLSKEGLNLFLMDIADSVSKSYQIIGLSIDPENFKLKEEFNEVRS